MNFCLYAVVVRYDRKAISLPVRTTPRYRGLGACGCPTLRKHPTNTPYQQNEWLLTLLSSPVFPMTSCAPVSARARSRWTFCCWHHRHGMMIVFHHPGHKMCHCLPLPEAAAPVLRSTSTSRLLMLAAQQMLPADQLAGQQAGCGRKEVFRPFSC